MLSIAFLDQSTAQAAAGLSTLAVTLVATPNKGDTLVAFIGNDFQSVSSINNTGGVWQILTGGSFSHQGYDMWVCPNVDGSSSTVTINWPLTTGARGANVARFRGLSVSPIDQHTLSTGAAGASFTTATITPVRADSLVVAGSYVDDTYSSGPTDGFTGLTRLAVGLQTLMPSYLIQKAAASIQTGWTVVGTANHDTGIASLFSAIVPLATPMPQLLPQ